MSQTLSIFVGDGPSMEDCKTFIEDHLKIPLSQRVTSAGSLFEGEFLGTCVTLFDNHGLVDDCGILFTRFRLEIDFTRYAGADAVLWSEATLRSAVVSLAENLSLKFNARCIVVQDLQQMVQSYGPPAD